jgi:hypothetical protein
MNIKRLIALAITMVILSAQTVACDVSPRVADDITASEILKKADSTYKTLETYSLFRIVLKIYKMV